MKMNDESLTRESSIFAHTGPVDPDLFISDGLSDLDSPPKRDRKRWKSTLLGTAFFKKVFKKKKKIATHLATRKRNQDKYSFDEDEDDFLTDQEGNGQSHDDHELLGPISSSPTHLLDPDFLYKDKHVRFSEYYIRQLYYSESQMNGITKQDGISNLSMSKPSRGESNRKTRHKPRKRRKQKRQPNRRYQDLHDEDDELSWESLSEAGSDDHLHFPHSDTRKLARDQINVSGANVEEHVHHDQKRDASIKIQKWIRFHLIYVKAKAVEEDHKRMEAALKIQRRYRSFCDVAKVKNEGSAVDKVTMMESGTQQSDIEYQSAFTIQKYYRCFYWRKLYITMKGASVKIQKAFRNYSGGLNNFRLFLLENRLKMIEMKKETDIRSILNQISKRKELYKVQTELDASTMDRLVDDQELRMNLCLEEYKTLSFENTMLSRDSKKLNDENEKLERSIDQWGEMSAHVELRIREAAGLQEKLCILIPEYEKSIVRLQNAINVGQKYCLVENMLRKRIGVKIRSMLEILHEKTCSKDDALPTSDAFEKVLDSTPNYISTHKENHEASVVVVETCDSAAKLASNESLEIFFDSNEVDLWTTDYNSVEMPSRKQEGSAASGISLLGNFDSEFDNEKIDFSEELESPLSFQI